MIGSILLGLEICALIGIGLYLVVIILIKFDREEARRDREQELKAFERRLKGEE